MLVERSSLLARYQHHVEPFAGLTHDISRLGTCDKNNKTKRYKRQNEFSIRTGLADFHEYRVQKYYRVFTGTEIGDHSATTSHPVERVRDFQTGSGAFLACDPNHILW